MTDTNRSGSQERERTAEEEQRERTRPLIHIHSLEPLWTEQRTKVSEWQKSLSFSSLPLSASEQVWDQSGSAHINAEQQVITFPGCLSSEDTFVSI